MIPGSSAVERVAVNHEVVGSNPARGASQCYPLHPEWLTSAGDFRSIVRQGEL